ncbi:hypothetical protein RCH21_003081 [Arthrobacter sp. PL16]|uniref:hypothetical protein n=1 Tax=Arthrobacter sp. PL16 TaxID=3071720 RepID=UPI002DFBC88B|nr:hypothetical protein [Arthrobacter sp. PL16]
MTDRRLRHIVNVTSFLVTLLASLGFTGLGLRISPFALMPFVFIGGYVVNSVLPRFSSRDKSPRH